MSEEANNFEEIYAIYKNMVYNLSLHYVQNIEDAQEITQDVFVSINQSLEKFNRKSSIKTWIYRITINKSLDYIKSGERKKRSGFLNTMFFGFKSELKFDIPIFNHPGVLLEQKEATKRIFNYINQLPDNQKTALILNKIEHKSQIEISEIMNISTKAVESLIGRAKINLLKKLNFNEG